MFRLMTGSFDKTVKIWSIDGKFTHKLDNFLATISGICYVPRNKTVWVAGGTSYASLFDPKSGDNVCFFVKDVTNVYLCKIITIIPICMKVYPLCSLIKNQLISHNRIFTIELRMDEFLTQNLIYRLLSYKNPITFYVSENIALFCYNVTCNNL